MVRHKSDAADNGLTDSGNLKVDGGFNMKYEATGDAKTMMKKTEDEEFYDLETGVKPKEKTRKEDITDKKKYKSYSESNGIPFFFFSWMTNWIKYVGKGVMKHEEFPEIPDEDFDQEATARFGVYLQDYRDYDACNRVVKFVGRSRLCVLKVFRKNFILLYMFSIFNDIFEVFNIFLLKHVMKQKMPTTVVELFKYLALVLLVLTVNMIDIVTDGHHYFYYRRLVLRIENLLFSFLFSRILSKNYYGLSDGIGERQQAMKRLDTDISITMLPRFHNSSNLLDSSNNIKIENKKVRKRFGSRKVEKEIKIEDMIYLKNTSSSNTSSDNINRDSNSSSTGKTSTTTKDKGSIENKENIQNDGILENKIDSKKYIKEDGDKIEKEEKEKEKVWVGDEEDISLLNLALFDISEISWGILKLVDLCAIPLKIMIVGCWLYYQVGGTALKAVVFILISSTIMVLSECQSAKLVKGYVTRIDDRISKTLIILENLTNFKMFRWIELCKQSVLVSRLMELQLCMKRAILSAIGSWLGISLPNILALAVFLIYSTNNKHGASLDPSFSIPLLHTLNHFIKPFRELPSDLSDHLETSISCTRIETFLFSKELGTYINTSYSSKRNKSKYSFNKDKRKKTSTNDNSDNKSNSNSSSTDKTSTTTKDRENKKTKTKFNKITFGYMSKTKVGMNKDNEGEETKRTISVYDDMGDTGRSTVFIETDNDERNVDVDDIGELLSTKREEYVEIVGLEEFGSYSGEKRLIEVEEEIEYKEYKESREIKELEYKEIVNESKYSKENKIDSKKYIKEDGDKIEKDRCVVYMKGASFCRGDKKVLSRMDFRLESRDKVVISGSNIAEKFIFTMSLIDELHHTEGIYYNHYINKDVCTGIVSQNPWIPMGTIRDIILFGSEYNKILYDRIIDICQLKYDFSNWKLKDLRFVDEGGQNLSTGQKVRISLARSLYTLLISRYVDREKRTEAFNENANNTTNTTSNTSGDNRGVSNSSSTDKTSTTIQNNKESKNNTRNIKEDNKMMVKRNIKENEQSEVDSMIILDEIFTVLDPVIGYTIFNNLFGEGGILNGFTCIVTVQDSFLQILKGFKFDKKFKFYNLTRNNINPISIVYHELDEASEEVMKQMETIRQESMIGEEEYNSSNNNRSNRNIITNITNTDKDSNDNNENMDDIGELLSTKRDIEDEEREQKEKWELEEKYYSKISLIRLENEIENIQNDNKKNNKDKIFNKEKDNGKDKNNKNEEDIEIKEKKENVEKTDKDMKFGRSRLFTDDKDGNPMLVKFENFVWYLKKVGLGLVGFVVGLSFLAMSLNVASDIVISKWTSVPKENFSQIREKLIIIRGIYTNNYYTKLNYLYIFTFITSCTIVLYLWRSLLEVQGTMNAAHKVYSSAMNGVLKCPIVTFNQIPIGNINNRLSADQSYVDYSVFRRFSHFVSSFIFTVLTAMSLCYLNPWAMLLIPILVLVSYFCVFKMYIPMSIFNMRSNLETRGYICSQFSEVIAGAHVIKSLNNEEYVMENFLDYLRIHQRTKFFSHAASSWTMIRLRVLTYPLIVINLLIPLMPLFKNTEFNSIENQEIASRSGSRGGLGNESSGDIGSKEDMVDGKIGLALTYSYKFAKLLKSSLNKVVELESEMCASQRLQELTKLDPEYNILDERLFDGKKAKEKVKKFIMKRIQDINFKTSIASEYNYDIDCSIVGEQKYFDVHQGLSVNKVVVKYDSKMCLNQITFNTEKNEHIGLIGRTGAGKSTLLMSLSGLIKLDSGNIKIDGVDISELNNEEMRKLVAILPHTPPLLPGWTVRRYVDPENEFTDEEIFEGVKSCKIMKMLMNLLENSRNIGSMERMEGDEERLIEVEEEIECKEYKEYKENREIVRLDKSKGEKNNSSNKENNKTEKKIEDLIDMEYEEKREKIIIEERIVTSNSKDNEERELRELEEMKEAMEMRITKQKENNYVIVSDIDLQYLTLLRLYMSRNRLRLILIDECYTMEVGNEMELEPIYLMINRLFKQNVIIIVAHQPETLSLCNRVLLLEGGKIVETEFKN